jgi:NADP-dependent 3-hydroxy acid dehydrogenase YdfG
VSDSLKDRVVVVAGAAGPVGTAVVQRLASAGAYVIAAGRSEESLLKLVEEATSTGGRAVARVVNLADGEAVREWAEDVEGQYGSVAGLVHLVGGYRGAASFARSDFADENFLHEAIMGTLAHTTVAFHDLLIASPRGRFAMVSAVAASAPTARSAAYASAKAAAEAWTLAMADSFAAEGGENSDGPAAVILVIKAVVTAQMRSDRPDASFEGFIAPDDLADVIAELWDKPANEINGARLWLTDRPAPVPAIDRAARG